MNFWGWATVLMTATAVGWLGGWLAGRSMTIETLRFDACAHRCEVEASRMAGVDEYMGCLNACEAWQCR